MDFRKMFFYLRAVGVALIGERTADTGIVRPLREVKLHGVTGSVECEIGTAVAVDVHHRGKRLRTKTGRGTAYF